MSKKDGHRSLYGDSILVLFSESSSALESAPPATLRVALRLAPGNPGQPKVEMIRCTRVDQKTP